MKFFKKKLGYVLGIVGKPSMTRILWSWLILSFFRPNVCLGAIEFCEKKLSLRIQLKKKFNKIRTKYFRVHTWADGKGHTSWVRKGGHRPLLVWTSHTQHKNMYLTLAKKIVGENGKSVYNSQQFFFLSPPRFGSEAPPSGTPKSSSIGRGSAGEQTFWRWPGWISHTFEHCSARESEGYSDVVQL